MKRVGEQVNFNTILLLGIGALITFGIKKADDANTIMIQLSVRMTAVENRVTVIEGVIVPRRHPPPNQP